MCILALAFECATWQENGLHRQPHLHTHSVHSSSSSRKQSYDQSKQPSLCVCPLWCCVQGEGEDDDADELVSQVLEEIGIATSSQVRGEGGGLMHPSP